MLGTHDGCYRFTLIFEFGLEQKKDFTWKLRVGIVRGECSEERGARPGRSLRRGPWASSLDRVQAKSHVVVTRLSSGFSLFFAKTGLTFLVGLRVQLKDVRPRPGATGRIQKEVSEDEREAQINIPSSNVIN